MIARLSRADIFFKIGVPFENFFIPKLARLAPDLNIIDTSRGTSWRRMRSGHFEKESSQDDHHRAEAGHDPHIWLNPLLVKKQAAIMAESMTAIDPAHGDVYRQNYHLFAQELEAVHGQLQKVLAPVRGETMFVFHPSFGYFAEAYGLEQVAVELEGKTPKGKDLARFIALARQQQVRVIFVQPQFDSSAARKIARAIKGVVVPIDPLERDYLYNLQSLAGQIRAALVER